MIWSGYVNRNPKPNRRRSVSPSIGGVRRPLEESPLPSSQGEQWPGRPIEKELGEERERDRLLGFAVEVELIEAPDGDVGQRPFDHLRQCRILRAPARDQHLFDRLRQESAIGIRDAPRRQTGRGCDDVAGRRLWL